MNPRELANLDAYLTRGPEDGDNGRCGVCMANGDSCAAYRDEGCRAEDDTLTCHYHTDWIRCGDHYRAPGEECDSCEEAPDAR